MTEQDQDPTPEPEGAQIDAAEPDSGTPEDADTFPRAYVEQLRREAAEHRKKAAQVDTMREALQAALIREASRDLLHDPAALVWDESFNGEDGMPDPERIRAAAEALAHERPWLSRPRGDVGQGFRGTDSDAVDLAGLLRAGA